MFSGAAFFIAPHDKAVALDILSRIKFVGVSKIAAEALSAFVRQGALSWTDTDRGLRKSILTQLVECPDRRVVRAALEMATRAEPARLPPPSLGT